MVYISLPGWCWEVELCSMDPSRSSATDPFPVPTMTRNCLRSCSPTWIALSVRRHERQIDSRAASYGYYDLRATEQPISLRADAWRSISKLKAPIPPGRNSWPSQRTHRFIMASMLLTVSRRMIFSLGMITDFLSESALKCDAYVIAPDGSCAGLVWESGCVAYFKQVLAPEVGR